MLQILGIFILFFALWLAVKNVKDSLDFLRRHHYFF